jgi:glycosyltransferase involved in cell wall biosynthesis
MWWTSTVDHFTKRLLVTEGCQQKVQPGLTLQFLHGRIYTRNVSLARWINHREIAAAFFKLAGTQSKPDVILCSYPTIELSAEAVRFGNTHRIPVLLDIRDLWPEEIAMRMPRILRPFARVILWPLYQQARNAIHGATGIVAISHTYLEWARRFGNRLSGRCDFYAPMGYELAAPASKDPDDLQSKLLGLGVDPTRKIVWFCGTFVGNIDLGTVIEAARILVADVDIQFVITGTGERDAEWRALARGLPNVVFTGWANRDELAWLAACAWIGLGAYKRDAMMSLPNKLFEYMAAGLPIVSSLTGEASALIVGNDVGVTYVAGEATDLAEKLQGLVHCGEKRKRLAENAHRLFREHFVADVVYGGLALHLERCAAENN